jgi:hypothetical protein
MSQLPLDMVISVCVALPKPDLLNVICCCKSICENKNAIILEWIKHTMQVGVLFKLSAVCHGILLTHNMLLINEMFVRAAFIGRTDIVKSCLAIGANVNHRAGEAVVLAARFGYTEIIEVLLESGVDVHAQDDEALMCSIAKGNHYITNRLIQSGASINSPAVARGFQLHSEMWCYRTPDIEPWHNNACPPPEIKRKTLLDKFVSAVCKTFNFCPQNVNHNNSDKSPNMTCGNVVCAPKDLSMH